MTIRPPSEDRSREIFDGVLAHLEAHGETPLRDIARATRSSVRVLGNARWLMNLRLSAQRHPSRVIVRYERGRAIWSLSPVSTQKQHQ